MRVSLETLFASSPYLTDLAARHAEWFEAAREVAPDEALAGVLAEVGEAGCEAASEESIGRALRIAKGRVALLAAVAEVEERWTHGAGDRGAG